MIDLYIGANIHNPAMKEFAWPTAILPLNSSTDIPAIIYIPRIGSEKRYVLFVYSGIPVSDWHSHGHKIGVSVSVR